jgi:hypothetical protein
MAKSGASGGSPAYGGTQVTVRPMITGLSCLSGCSSASSASVSSRPVKVRPDATVKIRGRNLSGVQSVLFTGAPGSGDDVRVDPAGVGRLSVDVSVPGKAVSGPIVLLASNMSSPPSRQRLLMIDPPRGDGGHGDGDNGDGDHHGDGGGNSDKGGGGGGASDSLIWPVPSHMILSPFGENRGSHFHSGVDILAPVGTPVKAAAGGTVLFAGPSGAYGNYICVAHSTLSTCYAHLGQMLVTAGTQVSRGQELGLSGMTGNSTGPHLHFEVRTGTRMWATAVDPLGLLDGEVMSRTPTTAHSASVRSPLD